MTRRLARSLILSLGLSLAVVARADRIHLEGGGVVEADSWVEDGAQIHIEGDSGSISIPKSIVVRIERTPPGGRAGGKEPRPEGIARSPASGSGPSPERANREERQDDGSRRLRELLLEGRDALAARDYERAAARFREAISFEAVSTSARIGYAVAAMALGRDPLALSVVLDGLAQDPTSADLHELLGDLRDREERVDLAQEAWLEAFRLVPNDRRRSKIERAARELQAGRDFAFSAAAHFNLRYEGTLDRSLAADVLDHLEERYAELSGAFRHAPEQPITVLLYPAQQFRDVTQVGEAVRGVYDGKIRVPLGGLSRLDGRARRVLVHELAHAFVQSKTRGNCPRWLHEGIAQRFEGRPLTRADVAKVRSLLGSAEPESWESRGLSYPAALSLTSFLESLRGWDGLLELLDRLGRGEAAAAALEAAYGAPYEELCRRWAVEVHASGGDQP